MECENTPAIPECCAKEENIEILPTTNPDAYIRRCRVCGRNHYFMKVQPVPLGAQGQD
jgi:hypothetical protein